MQDVRIRQGKDRDTVVTDKITEDNYYDITGYMSASLFKKFKACEAEALAELNHLYVSPITRALIVGAYMDAKWSPEEMDGLILRHRPDLYKKDGKPYADIAAADAAYERAYRDKMFRHFVADGEHQAIFVAEIAGVPFKGKLDSYFPGDKIVDLKYMKDMENKWVDGEKKTFIDVWGYDLQLAIYRELVAQNNGGEYLPCYIACITKESTPQIDIIEIPDWKLQSALEIVKHYAPIYQEIIDGKREPKRCEKCDYCRETKTIEKVTRYEDLLIA